MRHLNLLISTAFVSLMLLFAISCKKESNNPSNTPNKPSTNKVSNYIEVQNSKLIDSPLPSNSSNEVLASVSGNSNVLRGGSNQFKISSLNGFKKVLIGINDIKEHLELSATNLLKDGGDTSDLYVPIAINSNLPTNNFIIKIAIVDEDGEYSNVQSISLNTIEKANIGNLQVSVSWDQENDVDLHLILPDQRHIGYYETMKAIDPDDDDTIEDKLYEYLYENASNYNEELELSKLIMDFYKNSEEGKKILAFLDLDSNPICLLDYFNNESIIFPGIVPSGEYKVNLDLFSNCGIAANTNYVITVRYLDQLITTSVSSNPYSGYLVPADANNPNDDGETILTFNVNSNDISVANQNTETEVNYILHAKYGNLSSSSNKPNFKSQFEVMRHKRAMMK